MSAGVKFPKFLKIFLFYILEINTLANKSYVISKLIPLGKHVYNDFQSTFDELLDRDKSFTIHHQNQASPFKI